MFDALNFDEKVLFNVLTDSNFANVLQEAC